MVFVIYHGKNPGNLGVRGCRRHLGRGLGGVTKPPAPALSVTRPRPIFARVQDSAGNRGLHGFQGFSATKTPSKRLQAS